MQFLKSNILSFEEDLVSALALGHGEVQAQRLEMFLRMHFSPETAKELQKTFSEDIAFFRSLDPASKNYSEAQILSVRRGMAAIGAHRIFQKILEDDPNLLYEVEVMAKHIQKDTNVEIHPMAKIGVPFAIDHGHGTVIGATAEIGKHVFVYHGVTFGATGKRTKSGRRHPKIGDHAYCGNGSQILGPAILETAVSIASGAIIADAYLGENSSVFLNVRVSGVRVPARTKILSAALENAQTYWAILDGETLPKWVSFEKVDVTQWQE